MEPLRAMKTGILASNLVAAATLLLGAACGTIKDEKLGPLTRGAGAGGRTDGGASEPGLSNPSPNDFVAGSPSPSESARSDACTPNLTARLRDFVNQPGFLPASALDDDFENVNMPDRGIVATDLGADLKPVYANPSGTTPTTHGKTQFDWWYRDTPDKNVPFDYPIVLSPGTGGVQTFDDQAFFPLDGRGWNDEYTAENGQRHNFSFTLELHTTFGYAGGEVFTFSGDDDVFIFIDKKLVVDLGGVHGSESKSIQLDTLVTDDAQSTPVPLVKGTTYPLDIFYSERHTSASHFRMDTSIVFNNCDAIIVPK